VVIHGKVDGNVTADRVELKKSAIHLGNIVTQRVIIEEGAYFKGTIDIQREQKPEAKLVAAGAAVSGPATAAAAAPAPQSALVEPKR
jgi:cytoskeletal protein CcmA (bactofilin family)